MLIMFASSCKQQPEAHDGDSLMNDSVFDTDSATATADSTMWGHMGEGTSMNVIEFITLDGDTLYLCREDANTGQMAQMLGDLRNANDLLAITTLKGNEEEPVIATCINTTQMMGVWKNGKERVAFYADGSADNEASTLHNWQIANGELILTLEQNTEYGTIQRNDTMKLVELTDHELVYSNRHGQTFRFNK